MFEIRPQKFNYVKINLTQPSTRPAHGRHACAFKISPSYDAAFWRRYAANKINKLKYVVMCSIVNIELVQRSRYIA